MILNRARALHTYRYNIWYHLTSRNERLIRVCLAKSKRNASSSTSEKVRASASGNWKDVEPTTSPSLKTLGTPWNIVRDSPLSTIASPLRTIKAVTGPKAFDCCPRRKIAGKPSESEAIGLFKFISASST